MPTLHLHVNEGFLVALRLVAYLNGHRTPEEELKAECKDYIKACLEQLDIQDFRSLLK